MYGRKEKEDTAVVFLYGFLFITCIQHKLYKLALTLNVKCQIFNLDFQEKYVFFQFEGGLAVTSAVVTGIMKLSDQQGTKLIKDVSIFLVTYKMQLS